MTGIAKLNKEKRELLSKIYQIDSKIAALTKPEAFGLKEGKYYALSDCDSTYYFRYEKSKNNGFVRDGEIWIRNVIVHTLFKIKSIYKFNELVTFDTELCAADSDCIKEITKEQYDKIITDFIGKFTHLIIPDEDTRTWYVLSSVGGPICLPEEDYKNMSSNHDIQVLYKGTREEVDKYCEKCSKA